MTTFAPGEEVAITLGFEYEGCREIEPVEAVFVRTESGEEIVLLGGARKEASGRVGAARYVARLEARQPWCCLRRIPLQAPFSPSSA